MPRSNSVTLTLTLSRARLRGSTARLIAGDVDTSLVPLMNRHRGYGSRRLERSLLGQILAADVSIVPDTPLLADRHDVVTGQSHIASFASARTNGPSPLAFQSTGTRPGPFSWKGQASE